MEKSEFTQQLAETATKLEPIEWINIALQVNDIDSVRHLNGGCRRALESYPVQPDSRSHVNSMIPPGLPVWSNSVYATSID